MFSLRNSVVLMLLVAVAPGLAQPQDEPFDYRRFLTPPKTTPEFWDAMKFEMEVGRYDLAAQHLHDMLATKPTAGQLPKRHEKEEIATFRRLRIMPRSYADRDKERQAREDVESLIDQITQAVR